MDPRTFARLLGTLTLIAGAVSLVPSLSTADDLVRLALPVSYGNFLGWFPMNIVNKATLILTGAAGLGAAFSKIDAVPRSLAYARVVSVATAVMAVLGAVPETRTLFGYWPLYGNANVAAAGLLAIISGAVGFHLNSRVPPGPAAPDISEPVSSR